MERYLKRKGVRFIHDIKRAIKQKGVFSDLLHTTCDSILSSLSPIPVMLINVSSFQKI